MTILEQSKIATEAKTVLERYGLKKRYVAKKCDISETTFYQFLNGKTALSEKQLTRVVAYIKDYVRRNG